MTPTPGTSRGLGEPFGKVTVMGRGGLDPGPRGQALATRLS